MATGTCEIIQALEGKWSAALRDKDVATLQELVHRDFVLIGVRSSGPFMMHREDWFEAIEKRDVAGIDLEVHDATATGDMMVGTVFARWRLKYLGREIEDCVVLTDVWVREDDRWQVLRRHSTPSPRGGCDRV
ncbi:MAG: nuclear transport factor 2 family protein [Sphingomicrobium sp.]